MEPGSFIAPIFVSSTWVDLQPERRAVERALSHLREAKFIGMEYFGSRTDTTRESSLQEVDRSAAYLGILGGRYGSGITEEEYRRAVERRLPCFIYIKDDETVLPEHRDTEFERVARLRELTNQHIRSKFRSPEDLAFQVLSDLHRWIVDSVSGLVADGESRFSAFEGRITNFVESYLGAPDRPVLFGGREPVLADLDSWLGRAEAPAYLLVASRPARGKSALLVRWHQRLFTRPDLTTIFFPISVRFRTHMSSVVFQTLASRLAALHGETPSLSSSAPSEEWRDVVSTYLRRPLPGARRLLLILDGVDEAYDWEAGTDLFPPSPLPNLRVVASARLLAGDVGPNTWLRQLGWNQHGLAATLDLPPLRAESIAELGTQAGLVLSGTVVESLYAATRQGEPLLVSLFLEDFRTHPAADHPALARRLDDGAPGLTGYFDGWWGDQMKLWGARAAEHRIETEAVINRLAAAFGPVSSADLRRLLALDEAPGGPGSASIARARLAAILDLLNRFVSGIGRTPDLVFSHPELAAFFWERLDAETQRHIDLDFVRWAREEADAFEVGTRVSNDISHYAMQHARDHLRRNASPVNQGVWLLGDSRRRAWEALGETFEGFLTDVEFVRETAERADRVTVEAGSPARSLGRQVRCALLSATASSLVALPAALTVAAAETGVWPLSTAIARARRHPLARERARALTQLAARAGEREEELLLEVYAERHAIDRSWMRSEILADLAARLGEPLSQRCVEEALEAAREPLADLNRVRGLLRVALRVPERFRPEIVREAFDLAAALDDPGDRASGIALVAEHEPDAVTTDVLLAAADFGPGRLNTDALRVVAQRLPSERLELLWDRTSALGEDHRAAVQRILVPLLEPSRFDELWNLSRQTSPALRPEALVALLDIAPQARREAVLREALQSVTAINQPGWRFRGLTDLLRFRPAEERSAASEALLADLGRLTPQECAGVFRSTVTKLPLAHQRALLEAIQGADSSSQSWALRDTASVLPESLLGSAIACVRAMAKTSDRLMALEALAPRLPAPLLRDALRAASPVDDAPERALAAATLIEHTAPPLRDRLLASAIDAVKQIADANGAASALCPFVAFLEDEHLDWALTVALGANGESRAAALVALTPLLHGERFSRAVEAARDGLDVWYPFLAAAVPMFSDEERAELLQTAVDEIETLDGWPGARGLCALAPVLSGQLMDRGLARARALSDAKPRTEAMLALMTRLPERRPELVDELMETIRAPAKASAAISSLNDWWRAETIGIIAPWLPREQANDALELTLQIDDWPVRLVALAPLIRVLPGELRNQLVPEAMMLVGLDEELFENKRVEAAGLLAEFLPDDVALELLTSDALSVRVVTRLMSRLASRLAPNVLLSACERTLHRLARVERRTLYCVLPDLIHVIDRVGGEPSLQDVAEAILESDRWSRTYYD